MKQINEIDRVYRFGCRPPRGADHDLALQLLGQAWLYREELRHVFNANTAWRKAAWVAELEASHVRAWEAHQASIEEVGHTFLFEKRSVYSAFTESLNEGIRAVRGARGHLLDAGTYWLVEAAIRKANEDTGFDPIAKQLFDGTGRIGAQIQADKQFPAERFSSQRVTLTPVQVDKGYYELTIFVGALKVKRSITWPVKLHRPFPVGARVKQVAVQRIRIGHRFRWEALVTVSFVPAEASRDPHAKGSVGIDVGWRDEGAEGCRVATHYASDGLGVLLIDTPRSFEYSDAVQGFRDAAFNLAKVYTSESGLAGEAHVLQWRNKSRLLRLAERNPTDLGLAWWRLRDRHLEDIAAGVRERAIRRRLDAFRVYADKLAKAYRVVVLEDMPMQNWVGKGETSPRERKRSTAALSLFQDVIKERFGTDRVHWVPAQNTTRTCADCGVVHPTSVGKAPFWTCEGCKKEHHQDENAARVLWAMGEREGDGLSPVRCRMRKAAPAKKKKKKEKFSAVTEDGDSTASRKPISNAAE